MWVLHLFASLKAEITFSSRFIIHDQEEDSWDFRKVHDLCGGRLKLLGSKYLETLSCSELEETLGVGKDERTSTVGDAAGADNELTWLKWYLS
jgi:hypothetical protein